MSSLRSLLVVFVAATPAFAQPKAPPVAIVYRDLRYGPHAERHTLDIYTPPSETPLPVIVWVHGGGWQGGNKDSGMNAVRLFADKGYAVASINYRLSQHAVYPAQVHDCKAAIRFLRGNAIKYNLNPDAIGVWGASAGGHLVALLGTTGGVKELEGDIGDFPKLSSRVQCVVDFYGPVDLTAMGAMSGANSKIDHDAPNSPESKLLGGAVQSKKDLAATADPARYATKDDAPFLIVHGDADPLVPLGQSELLDKALKKAGVPCELVTVKGGGHGGAGFATPELTAKIGKFFDAHLKGK